MKIYNGKIVYEVNNFGKYQENSKYSKYFIEESYLNLQTKPSKDPFTIDNITFEPRCRNN